MLGEGVLYCLQSRLWGRAGGAGGAEGSINAGGCNFNSFLRRTVRFVGESPGRSPGRPAPRPAPALIPAPSGRCGPSSPPCPAPPPQASTCSACAPLPW